MCHLQKVDDTLVDGCGNWEHLHSFREVKCLQGCSKTLWMGIKILWLFSVAAEDSIVVVTIGNQSGGPQCDSRQWPILNSHFIMFMFSSSGGMKFLILVENSDSTYYFGYNPGVRWEHPTNQLLWATARTLVTRVSLVYLRSRWVFLVTGVNQEKCLEMFGPNLVFLTRPSL